VINVAEKGIEVAREVKQAKKEKEREDKQRAEKAGTPEVKPEAKPESGVEPKPEPKVEAKPEVKPEAKPEARPAKKEEKPKKEAKAKEEKKEEVLEERILTIPLRDAWKVPRTRRTRAAVKILKKQLERHLKKPVVLDVSLNRVLWKKGIQKPPRRIKVKARIMKERAKIYPVESA
jgi:ribosomal protein L31E